MNQQISNIDPEVEEILAACSVSTKVTALTLFPERFNRPFAHNVHDKIFDLIDGPYNKVAIAAPRGWGKTSVVALAYIARHILFRLTDFVVYINMSHDAAALQTENLRRELVSNRIIKSLFGPVKAKGVNKNEFEETFSKKSWVAYDTLVWPRGAGQQVRGVLFKNSRPGLIVIDDLEHPDEVMNEEIRKTQRRWLYADVIKAVPRLHMDWKIVYIDTLKHEDSLLQHLLDAPDWKSIRLEACDDDFNSVAPEFMSNEQIAIEWQAHVDAGETDVFFRELRNLPISTVDAAFKKEYFKYYNLPPQRTLGKNDLSITDADVELDQSIESVILVDPAKTVKMHSAESAIVCVGIDLNSAKLFIRDCIAEKLYPDELYDAIFSMAARVRPVSIGIEETSLNEFIKQPIKSEMFKRGTFYNMIWLKPRGGQKKVERIKELVPYYRLGYIYHNAQCATIPKLEAQLMMFPRSSLLDLMDCEAYILQLMELGARYFTPTDRRYDLDPESEFAELEYEEPVEGWRIV